MEKELKTSDEDLDAYQLGYADGYNASVNLNKKQVKKLTALLQEGIDGFGRVLVATSDDRAVRDWQRRCKAALKEK
jgi:hypothetical protein